MVRWQRSLCYCSDLLWVCLHLPTLDDETHCVNMENTLHRLDVELVLEQPWEYLARVGDVIRQVIERR